MSEEKIIYFIKDRAKSLFPEISEDRWTLKIVRWADKTFQIEYVHGIDINKRIKFYSKDNEITLSVGKVKSVEEELLRPLKQWTLT